MPQFCILFYANYTSYRSKGGGAWPNTPPNTPLNVMQQVTFSIQASAKIDFLIVDILFNI